MIEAGKPLLITHSDGTVVNREKWSSIMKPVLKSFALLIALASALLLYLVLPFPLLSTQDSVSSPFLRVGLVFLPLINASLYFNQIFGDTFTLFDPCRIKIIGIGLFLLGSVLGTGRFVFLSLRHLFDPKNGFKDFTPWEELFFIFILGMAALSAYLFWAGFIGWINRYTIVPLVLFALTEIFFWIKQISFRLTGRRHQTFGFRMPRLTGTGILAGFVLLFASLYLLAGTIPPYEYDMLEYHAQGAREIFESGRIAFSPHNIYLNMPLGSEMFYLAGILLTPPVGPDRPDTLCQGVTAGKFFLAFVPVFCALGTAIFTERLLNLRGRAKPASWAAALSLLTFPEIFQVSANGLNEAVLGLTAVGSLYAVYFALKNDVSLRQCLFLLSLSGLYAGFAAACKYTATPFIVLPIAIGFFLLSWKRSFRTAFAGLSLFTITATISGGGWYLKNLLMTGNPFYPLAYSLFGDRTGTWNAVKNTRWLAAHTPRSFHLENFLDDVTRLWTDNFSSPILPLLGIFLILCFVRFFRRKKERPVFLLSLYFLFFFFLWWFSTHRLTRFLVPVLPIGAIVTAVFWFRGYKAARWRPLRAAYLTLWILVAIYSISLGLLTTPGILVPVKSLAADPDRYGVAAILPVSPIGEISSDSTLLLVGEARAFAFRSSPILYNTCWDNSQLANLLPKRDMNSSRLEWTDEEILKIKTNFRAKRIESILVDNNEIQRFLSKGNYGLTDSSYAEPSLFNSLVRCGILEPVPLPGEFQNVDYYRVTEN